MYLSKVTLVSLIFTLCAQLAAADGPKEVHVVISSGTTVVENLNTNLDKPTWQAGGAIVIRPAGSGVAPTQDDTHTTVGVTGGPAGGAGTVQLDAKVDPSKNIYVSIGSDRIASIGPYINRGVIPLGLRVDNGKSETYRFMFIPFGIINDNLDHNNSVGSGLRLEYIAHILNVLDMGGGAEGLVTAGNNGSHQQGAGLAGSVNVFFRSKIGQHIALKVEAIVDLDRAKLDLGNGQSGTAMILERHFDGSVQFIF